MFSQLTYPHSEGHDPRRIPQGTKTHTPVQRGNTGETTSGTGGLRNSKTANRLSECTLESHCRRRRGESVPHLSPYHVPAAQCSAPVAEVEHVRVTSCSWPDQDTFRGAVARRAWARYSSGINIALPSMITYARQRKCHGMSHAAPRSWLWFQSLYHWSDSGVSMPTHSLTSALTH